VTSPIRIGHRVGSRAQWSVSLAVTPLLLKKIFAQLGNVTLMVMRGLEDGDGDVRRYRSILRRFVVPAFASANAEVGV
jgi:hypothetical protein